LLKRKRDLKKIVSEHYDIGKIILQGIHILRKHRLHKRPECI